MPTKLFQPKVISAIEEYPTNDFKPVCQIQINPTNIPPTNVIEN
jgi:hypothetical protein